MRQLDLRTHALAWQAVTPAGIQEKNVHTRSAAASDNGASGVACRHRLLGRLLGVTSASVAGMEEADGRSGDFAPRDDGLARAKRGNCAHWMSSQSSSMRVWAKVRWHSPGPP